MRLSFPFLALTILSLCFSCNSDEEGLSVAPVDENEELSGGVNLTAHDFSENAFGVQANNLNFTEQGQFVTGNAFFRSNWVTAPSSVQTLDGLGPIMNAIACGSCHFKDGRARPPLAGSDDLTGLLLRLSIPGIGPHGGTIDEPVYGGQFQDRSILGVDGEGKVRVTYEEIQGQYADGTTYSLRKPTYEFYDLKYGSLQSGFQFSPRIAQQLPGLGLLENVSEETILSYVDENDADGDGISGRANYVWDEQLQETRLGRFGWKSNQPTIYQQTAGAFNGDIGITTSLYPNDGLTPTQKERYPDLVDGGSPEIDDATLDKVAAYIRTLSVPARRDWQEAKVLRGKLLFTQMKCSSCHIPQMETSSKSSTSALNGQIIRPYTDLLLHDMGDGLADNRPDFLATGNEWRTAPLWGIGMIKTVNKHTFLLHDGRARNIEEAILWHGGEAQQSKMEFTELNKFDREAVIKFLESL
ncbi:MAG TPA: di-heme oxidoredictase family protein [Fulvivirga sp.]|nr:di-heme oxidoredictase family protein [Fulvivirga sp.]